MDTGPGAESPLFWHRPTGLTVRSTTAMLRYLDILISVSNA
jgi:hypothetical protein